MDIAKALSLEFNIKLEHANNIISLLDEGCTVPFIARYRKEMHGSCDDQKIRDFSDRLDYLRNFEKRKEECNELLSPGAFILCWLHGIRSHHNKGRKVGYE